MMGCNRSTKEQSASQSGISRRLRWVRGRRLDVLQQMSRRALCGLGISILVAGFAGAPSLAAAESGLSPSGIYRETAQSVVVVFGFGRGASGNSGTGTLLTRDGLLLTNDHVISNEKTGRLFRDLVVYFKPTPISGDHRKDLRAAYLVDVVARNVELDLALLQVKNPPSGLRPIVVGDSEQILVGEQVAAIGHPGGGGLWTLTTGTISSSRRDGVREIFQTDAAINPGNSGGPLLDEYARLVGINTFVRRVNEKGVPLEGLNYSLRSRAAIDWVNQETRGQVEVVSRPLPPSPAPARVADRERVPQSIREAPLPGMAGLLQRSLIDSSPNMEPKREAGSKMLVPRTADEVRERRRDKMDRRDWRPRGKSAPGSERAEHRKEVMPEPGFRRFRGPRGETLYGVPNPEVGLRDTLRQARKGFRALTERAEESVDEMDGLLDQYENF